MRIFNKYPRIFLLALIGFLVFFIFFWAEFLLRYSGSVPGVLQYSPFFNVVDELKITNDLKTDHHGIVCINEEYVKIGNRLVGELILDYQTKSIYNNLSDWTTVFPVRDFPFLHLDRGEKSELKEKVKELKNKDPALFSKLDSAILSYSYRPFINEGFRSISFQEFPDSTISILLIGDSFTFGCNPKSNHQSFADNLLARGYAVFNTGMIGADPAQYEKIAEIYTPVLKPDYVIFNYFLGNDDLYYFRDVEEGKPNYHQTNAGWIWAYPNGCFLTAEEAYDHLLNEIIIPDMQTNNFNRICGKTVLGTKFWKTFNFGKQYLGFINNKCDSTYRDRPISEKYIQKAFEYVRQCGATPVLCLIPNWESFEIGYVDQLKSTFQEITYFIPAINDTSYYNTSPSDGHFNKKGHLMYADFLEKVIREKGQGAFNLLH